MPVFGKGEPLSEHIAALLRAGLLALLVALNGAGWPLVAGSAPALAQDADSASDADSEDMAADESEDEDEEELDPEEKARRELNKKSYYWGKPSIPKRYPVAKGWFRIPAPPKKEIKKFQFMPPISAKAKLNFMQSLMYYNPFSIRQMVNMMTTKKKAAKGLSFEEVVESLKIKANELNMRHVGTSTPWKVIREIRGSDDFPKVEIYSFCDLETLALVLEYMPDFIIFIPCRVAVVEDGNGDIWVVMLEWDVRWLDTSPNPNRISEELRKRAISVRERLEQMMEAAANGDL